MSLLLQALKKAEEDKRRRAAAAEAEPDSPGVEFPTLNLAEEDLVAAPGFIIENTPPESEIQLASDSNASAERAEGIELHPSAQHASVVIEMVQFDPAPGITAAEEPAEPVSEIAVVEEPVEPVSEIAVVEKPAEPVPDIAVIEESAKPAPEQRSEAPLPDVPPEPPLTAPIQPADLQRSPQFIAKSLFTKSPRPAGRGLLPWLVLGAALLSAGMLAWFTWQYRQLTQPSPQIVLKPAASAPIAQATPSGYVAEPIVNEEPQVNTQVAETSAVPAVTPVRSSALDKSIQPTPRTANEAGELNLAPKFIRQAANPLATEPVMQAWQAYQSGDFAQAERIYRKVLQSDPRQRDALLGLAAIAQQRGETAAAETVYRRLLQQNPQDDTAKAALLGLNSAQMPEKDAVQLEQSGKADPLVLGHYFAAQQRWSQAQEQFFLAYTANPNSADAALNLAVSLDHLNQTAVARAYYRKALQAKEQSNFDRSKVEQRLAELDSAAEQKP